MSKYVLADVEKKLWHYFSKEILSRCHQCVLLMITMASKLSTCHVDKWLESRLYRYRILDSHTCEVLKKKKKRNKIYESSFLKITNARTSLKK